MLIHRKRKRQAARTWWLISGVLCAVVMLTTCAPPVPTPVPVPTSPPGIVDLSGKIDNRGYLLADVEIGSPDGRAKLSLTKGTLVLDAQGQPAKSVTVTTRQPHQSESAEAYLDGLAFDFGGGTIRPLGRLTIQYDPPPAYSAINTQDPQIGGFFEEKKIWVKTKNPILVDLKAHTVTAQIGELGSFMIVFWFTQNTPPISLLPHGATRLCV